MTRPSRPNTGNLLEIFLQVGPLTWPLFVVSIVVLTIVLERFIFIARGRRITPDAMEGQCFSGRKASYNSLTSGVVASREAGLAKLRERPVGNGGAS